MIGYMSQNMAEVSNKIEGKLRKELGSRDPISYQLTPVAENVSDRWSLGGAFSKMGDILFLIDFIFESPRRVELRVPVRRHGVGCHVTTLHYACPLAKPVDGEISLEHPSGFIPKGRFSGDGQVPSRLNANQEALNRMNAFARTFFHSGTLVVEIQRDCKIFPDEQGSLLSITTLMRPTSNSWFRKSTELDVI